MGDAVGRRLAVNLVSRDNGVGLSADMDLLQGMLVRAGHDVARVEWHLGSMRRCDVAIFLELWNPRLAYFASATVGVFNLEWFQRGWIRDLHRITQLWAKSSEADMAYQRSRLHNSTLTGFLSRDLNDPTVFRTMSAIHVRGKSDFKGTDAVIEAWRRDPTLPPLTIVSHTPMDVPDHVRLLGRISSKELRREMNQASIHVCPSTAEGWGHYITEALSVGAVVVTTDASPMNEHVRPEWGILIPAFRKGWRGIVSEYHVTADAVAEGARRAASLSDQERNHMGSLARKHFDSRNAHFTSTALDLLARI